MSSSPTRGEIAVLAVASDAGSARVLLPVLRAIRGRGATVRGLVSGPAERIFAVESPDVAAVGASDTDAAACVAELLAKRPPDVVVTGAGCYNNLEHVARLAARRAGVPCVAVLDYWFEYYARFHRAADGADVESWPDIVCALDEPSRSGLVAAGCAAERVVITGAPNLEESRRWWRIHAGLDRGELATIVNVASDRPVWAFFSEPYRAKPDGRLMDGPGGLYGPDGSPLFGYTAVQILTAVIEVLERSVVPGTAAPQLLIKPHPLEWTEPLHEAADARRSSPIRIRVIEDVNPKELVAVADVVVGMSSVTLIEAALAGKVAISVQLGLSDAAPFDPCAANALGLTVAVRNQCELEATVADVLAGRVAPTTRPTAGLIVDGASECVADAVVARAQAGLTTRSQAKPR